MKKKLLVLTTAFLMMLSVTFAQEATPVPAAIVSALNQEFNQPDNVQWKTTDQFYKASFTVDGQRLEAFYAFDGQLMGVSRPISIAQLPMPLIRDTKEKAAAGQVTELIEMLSDRGTEYFVTISNGKDTKTYQSHGNSWTRY